MKNFDQHWRERQDIPDDVKYHLEHVEATMRTMEYGNAQEIVSRVRKYLTAYGKPPPVFKSNDPLNKSKGEYRLQFVTGYGFGWERWRAYRGDEVLGEFDCENNPKTLEEVLDILISTGTFPFKKYGGK